MRSFFNSFSVDGWFVEVFYKTATASSDDDTLEASVTGVGGMFAYQWMWVNFNQQLGFGYGNYSIDSTNTIFDSFSGGYPVIVYNLGLAF